MYRLIALCLLALAAIVPAQYAAAQDNSTQNAGAIDEPSPEQMKLARQVLAASSLSRSFDQILPSVADQAKSTLIRSNPQAQLGIIEIVDKVALQMVDRRPELENRLARVWAVNFSTEELQAYLDFFQTDAGKKLGANLVSLLNAQLNVSQAWAQELSSDILQRATEELQKITASEAQSLQAAPPETPQKQ
ncbi:DUF2059 domain-containing protein [Afifella sp. IM 167]|uniref:DUF2059 domain-containing protein n=1 Tax=Afifella sp. IM 167 TaxID=2033586 RepID=UPI001CCE109A|nr:DUF2059 domain-containing protein [Afifella sp. IM 167]MBZ8134181.1 hypothetical protein [Afifella sp. IM 167]